MFFMEEKTMVNKKIRIIFYFLLIVIFLVSCSSTEKQNSSEKNKGTTDKTSQEFEELKKLITSYEKQFNQTNDFREKIDICEKVTSEIDYFIESYNNKNINDTALSIKKNWSDKLENYYLLIGTLNENIEKKAVDAVKNKYRNYNIDKIELLNFDEFQIGDYYWETHIYKISMVGNVLGIFGQSPTVIVRGYIDVNNYSIHVNEANVN